MPSASSRPLVLLTALCRVALPLAICALAACGGADAELAPAAAGPAAELAPAAAGPEGQLRPLASPISTGGAAVVLRVRAAGSVSAGVGASAVVRFNGQLVAAGLLTHAELLDYELWVPKAAAGGSLDIALDNATGAGGAPARSLTIDAITLNGVELRPSQPGVVFDAGDGEAAFDGKALGRAERVISRNGALRFSIDAAANTKTSASANASPAGFYVDAQRGSDSQAGSFDRPWQTLQPLRTIALPEGHGIFLRCDSLWRGALVLGGTQLRDTTRIAGYGPECTTRKATLTGADAFIGGWQKSGTTWVRSLPAGTPKITQLFVDGVALRTAQWPNDAFAASHAGLVSGTALVASPYVATKAADTNLLTGKDLAGATIQLRTQPWLIETRQTKTFRDGQLELDRAPDWPARPDRTYLLQDKLWMLDVAGEFFHDTSTQQLYVAAPPEFAAADFNGLVIEGTVRSVALSLTGRSQLVVRDLALLAAGETGLAILDAPQTTVERVESSHNASYGLRLWHSSRLPASTPGSVVSDGLFIGNGRYGIDAVSSERTRLVRNQVLGTGMAPQHQGGVIAAIANGAGGITEDNRVDDSAYIGIHFSSQDASQVLRNEVRGFCLRLTDCGGIYTWTGQANAPLANGAVVASNLVLAVARAPKPLPKVQSEIVVGVYVDDHSHGVTVRDNLLAHVPMGVFVHNASRSRIAGNRIWMPSQTGLWASMDDAQGDAMRDNHFVDNVIVPAVHIRAVTGQLPAFDVAQAVWFWHGQAGDAALAPERNLFAGNTVVQLYGPVNDYAWMRGPGGERNIDAMAWRSLNPGERQLLHPARFDPLQPTLGPEKIQDGQFENGLGAWLEFQNPSATGGSAVRLSQQDGCSDACLGFTAGDRGDLLGSRPFTMSAGAPHVYRWTARMPAHSGATVGSPYISRDVTPWDMMTDGQGFVGLGPRHGGAAETLHFETYFIAKADAQARVNLQLETMNIRVAFDAVSVREVLGYAVAAPAEITALALAPKDGERLFGCSDLGWPIGCLATDIDGREVSWPLRVPAGGERFLLRRDTAFRR